LQSRKSRKKNLFMMMKSALFFILLLLELSACSPAAVEKEGLLWKITGKDIKQPSYLFGTFQGIGIGADFLDSIPGFYDAFNSVTQFVGESSNPFAFLLPKAKENSERDYGELYMPTDTTYRDLLSESDYQYLDSIIRLSGIPSGDAFFKTRPYYLWIMINSIKGDEFLQEIFGKAKSDFMDFYLFRIAKRKGYEVKGLDSPEMESKMEKLRYRSEEEPPFPRSLQESVDTLMSKVKKIDRELEEFDKSDIIEFIQNVKDAYKRQDLVELENLNIEGVKILKTISKKFSVTNSMDNFLGKELDLSKERVSSWMKEIPELISNQPTMIGVGVGRLCGKDGLINLLRQKGYQLENVK